jgi:hypothetical protein
MDVHEVPSFEAASAAYLAGLLEAIPPFIVRLENELARAGECELSWVDALESELVEGLRALLSEPAERQAEPPIGMVRRLVAEALAVHVRHPNVSQLERRGLLPRSAVDIAPELASLQVQWGLAKARELGASASGAASQRA